MTIRGDPPGMPLRCNGVGYPGMLCRLDGRTASMMDRRRLTRTGLGGSVLLLPNELPVRADETLEMLR